MYWRALCPIFNAQRPTSNPELALSELDVGTWTLSVGRLPVDLLNI